MLRTRGMPMRTLARFSISAMRSLADLVQAPVGIGSATTLTFVGRNTSCAAMINEIGVGVVDLVEAGLDILHLVYVFDRSLFAGGDDQTLLAVHNGTLVSFLNGDATLLVIGDGMNVDEGAQTVVLAEIAARDFVAVLRYSILRTVREPTMWFACHSATTVEIRHAHQWRRIRRRIS